MLKKLKNFILQRKLEKIVKLHVNMKKNNTSFFKENWEKIIQDCNKNSPPDHKLRHTYYYILNCKNYNLSKSQNEWICVSLQLGMFLIDRNEQLILGNSPRYESLIWWGIPLNAICPQAYIFDYLKELIDDKKIGRFLLKEHFK